MYGFSTYGGQDLEIIVKLGDGYSIIAKSYFIASSLISITFLYHVFEIQEFIQRFKSSTELMNQNCSKI